MVRHMRGIPDKCGAVELLCQQKVKPVLQATITIPFGFYNIKYITNKVGILVLTARRCDLIEPFSLLVPSQPVLG